MERKEAIEVIRKNWPDSSFTMLREALETLIPELKESEDERIRKAIISVFEPHKDYEVYFGVSVKNILAWLEKQVPVYLSHDDEIMIRQLTEYFTTGKGLQNTNDTVVEWLTDVKRKFEKQGEHLPKFRVGDTIKKSTGDIVTISEIDLKNREYRLSNTGFIPFKYEHLWELVEQKPADKVEPKIIDWSKHIKYEPNSPSIIKENPAWSEEDDNCLSTIIAEFSKCAGRTVSKDEWMRCNDFLNSLKNKVQPKQEWSEKDASLCTQIQGILSVCRCYNLLSPDLYKEMCDWLKSLRPQSTWKPSEEQIDALRYVTNFDYGGHKATLVSLYEQLKKLKE